MEFNFYGKLAKVVVMVVEERYQMQWDVYGTLTAVDLPVGDGAGH